MKLNKILAIALVAAAATACSDSDSYNTAADVTVSMGQATMSIPEDFTGSYYKVPIKLSGKANGPVTVTVDVAEGAIAAIETAHYVVTSKTVTFPEGVDEVGVEIRATGDTEINEDREFTVFIDRVEGATVEGNDRTVVTLLDDDHYLPEAYANIQGNYTFTAKDSRGNAVSQSWTITGVKEGEEGYLSNIVIGNMQGQDWVSYPATLVFDASTLTASLAVTYGGWCAEEVTFNGGELVADVMLASVNSSNQLVSSGGCSLQADEAYTSLTFPAGTEWVGALFDSASGAFSGSVWFWWMDMNLTKQ